MLEVGLAPQAGENVLRQDELVEGPLAACRRDDVGLLSRGLVHRADVVCY